MVRKYNFCVVILFIMTTFLSAQSLADLDSKNGFRHFKLGTSPDVVKNKFSDYSSTESVKNFIYTGDDIDSVSGVEITKIVLSYYKNKLMSITASFGNPHKGPEFTTSQYNLIVQGLVSTYGNKKYYIPQNTNVLSGKKWIGSKVELEIIMLDTRKYGFVSGYLNIYDKNIMQDFTKNQF